MLSNHRIFPGRFAFLLILLGACITVGTPCAELAVSAAPPDYHFPYRNPLYGTIAGYLSIRDVKVHGQKTITLNAGRCENVPVKAVIQDCAAAPLVVVLPGITGRADSDFSQLWPSWYADAGYHVLTFDSTVLPSINRRTRPGVSGNVWAETEVVGDLIAAFLDHPKVAGRVTQIGVVGMSYGALQALSLAQMAKSGKVPFKIDAVQAFSPPIHLYHSIRTVGDWYALYGNKYSTAELQKIATTKPSPAIEDSFPDDKLKAAMAASFHLELPAIVVHNNATYHMNLLPKGDMFNDQYLKLDHAAAWGFQEYMDRMFEPYWRGQLGDATYNERVEAVQVCILVPTLPDSAQIIIAEDDPLNSAADVAQVKACVTGPKVLWLPNGGHLGYVNEDWTRAKLLSIFSPEVKKTAAR